MRRAGHLGGEAGSGCEAGEAEKTTWRPPSFSGLTNSKPFTTLQPLFVGQGKGLEVQYRSKHREGSRDANEGEAQDQDEDTGDRVQNEEEEEDLSEEEGWDYQGMRNTCKSKVQAMMGNNL